MLVFENSQHNHNNLQYNLKINDNIQNEKGGNITQRVSNISKISPENQMYLKSLHGTTTYGKGFKRIA